MEDFEPSLKQIDDYQKPMPNAKKALLTKIAVVLVAVTALYLTLVSLFS